MNLATRAIFGVCVSLAAALASPDRASAQPPTGPDPRPKAIAPADLDRVIGGPTLVTLDYKDTRPEEIFASLAKQAGVHLDAYQSVDALKKLPALSFGMKDAPVLAALHALAAKLGLNFTFSGAGEFESSPTGLTLRLQAADDPQLRMEGPVLVRGPFLVIATSVQRSRTVSLSGPVKDRAVATRDDFWLDFVILADPKLARAGLLGAPTFFGSDGWTIRSIDGEGVWKRRLTDRGPAPLEWRFSAHRRIGPDDGPAIPPLKATAGRMLIATKFETWEIPDILGVKDLSKEVSLAEGKRRYTVHEVRMAPNSDISRRGEMVGVRLGVSGVGITKGMWSGWPVPAGYHFIETFRLVDADGRDYAPYGQFDFEKLALTGKFWSGRPRGVGAAAAGRPTRALWRLPLEIRTIEIPIEFTKMPAP